ncbi:hypothetical protein TWF225_003387 [Orbilia oligospora]|uniref:Uncharacterized protein n=1 Tax=Orbilia oligospora TaxID=2813651 RepID=A0A7C8P5H4_ORBOL|nr:hypothetical protein TWF751_003288 [Orbilia oligospora]KAF3188407.1 hypothetical protein TWF225_003387 [Orbilia oligospora]KAF3250023.1 hypothetical protein TWF128_007611 [Orbilia oligospora]KAF3263181.1 hypothetical protein TWF217_003626 [Orbilia oligospora]KAF3289032.1 hypothetical protein TWF132_007701 [Orbilia oligospora]
METPEIESKLEEQQFWDELDIILSTPCPTQHQIDVQLRSYLQLISTYRDDYLQSEYDMVKCGFRLIDSKVFSEHKTYVRRRFVGRFLKEPSNSARLHVITATLLYDGIDNPKTFELMLEQNAFARLIDLIWKDVARLNFGFHKLLLEVFYEMCRIQKLRSQDLEILQDDFIKHLLEQVEEGGGDPDDPYNYAIVKVLLVLNEQYMLSELGMREEGPPPTNRVVKVLSFNGPDFKTFGENIILLLNRETETPTQLLILKLLFLLFTTSRTYEYFYTNDLCVLVDVMIRSLADLPEEENTLRHMYLRVFHPLLSHTQLRHPPHYKRAEIIKLLNQLSNVKSQHFSPADPTTLRLVSRCNKVDWLSDSPIEETAHELARQYLGMSLQDVGSSMSVVEVAAVKEKAPTKPGSRKKERGAPPPPPPGRVRGVWGGLEKAPPPPEVNVEPPKCEPPKCEPKKSSPLANGSLRRRGPPPPIPSARSVHAVKVGVATDS